MDKKILSLLNQRFRASRRYSFHPEDDLPLVIWSYGEPKIFCDVSQTTLTLKATQGINIPRSRYQRLLRASQIRMVVVRGLLKAYWLGKDRYHKLTGRQLGWPRIIYPHMWSLVWAADGLWGCELPSGDDDFEETLIVHPRWYTLLHRSHTHAKPRPKRPTRLEQKDDARAAYERVQADLVPGIGRRVEGSKGNDNLGRKRSSGGVQDGVRKARWPA